MPRLLAVGHVTWDARGRDEVLGGSVSYASLAVQKLGWDAGVLTVAGGDFEPGRDLPGISVFVQGATRTTRFRNIDLPDGGKASHLLARASPVDLSVLPEAWKDPDALLLSPVAAEIVGGLAPAFEAGVVGAIAQGWVREFGEDGSVSPREFPEASRALEGVHVLFLSEHDLPDAREAVSRFLEMVPIVALTRGWRGVSIFTRHGEHEIPGLPRPEVDPTGAGDVFAASYLVGYHETRDPLEAAAFACCAASCVVEGVGVARLGDRAEVMKRIALRERLIEDGEWDE